ncbi:hypothetical protein GCM10010124_21760 [Pilimelia terevasa]|uniref:Carboxypeptidase regulatory-like domain-containing protein n=1 Tax=Pilimelia terevasa TaxID=53372 RepID=A0A8J3FJD9_9ACTN|nr:carboxypeptidase regulatory-like domain-containing protein [Pilimelia terevasa]GGK28719.1 hypothetical protein GCM10010124_21760 [Pilimelia terevasa]
MTGTEEVGAADAALLRDLRRMWTAADPAPADLAERVMFTLALEDLEVELAQLQEQSLAGARTAAAETATSITFHASQLTVLLTVQAAGAGADGTPLRRLDGWLAPGAALAVEVRAGDRTLHAEADADGRFALDGVPAGLVQLRIQPGGPLLRAVVTPAVQV